MSIQPPEHDARMPIRIEEGIAIITFNIPQKLNAMGLDLYTRLAALLRYASDLPTETCYATVVVGTGRFWSAGADVTATRMATNGQTLRDSSIGRLSTGNMQLGKACMEHRKILVAALNGPAVGLSAALLGWFDLLYATEDFFLLTPFTTLGLAAEGGASLTFPRRLGHSLANEALLLSRRIKVDQLLRVGFISQLFPKGDTFLPSVLTHLREATSDLWKDSLIVTKKLIVDGLGREVADMNNMNEIFVGGERFESGEPIKRFAQLANKERRHKL